MFVHLSSLRLWLTWKLFLQVFLLLSDEATNRLHCCQLAGTEGSKSRQHLKEATQAELCFQPEDTKQIPTVHLNRGLACYCKYFIEYILQTPQQFTVSHLLLTCATRLPSSLVGLFWWLPELSQSKYFAVLCSNAMGITKYWEPVVVVLVEQCNLPRTFVTSSGYRHSVLRLAWRYLSWSTLIN